MTEGGATGNQVHSGGIRWWPGLILGLLMVGSIVFVHAQGEWAFQKRNLAVAKVTSIAFILLVIWWTFFSRAPTRLRLSVTYGLTGAFVVFVALVRTRGMTGDLVPIFEFRWAKHQSLPAVQTNSAAAVQRSNDLTNADFPQFLGPDRDGVLSIPRLDTNWTSRPPGIVWRQRIGAACSGFTVVGNIAITQEQRGEDECVVTYDLTSGRQFWLHSGKARYDTVTAGEGPRATPTVVSNRIITFGATGILNCLELASGRLVWTRDVVSESGGKVLEWGCTSSPLVLNGLVIVHGGEGARHSLHAFRLKDGELVWSGGVAKPSYASLSFVTLAGIPQVLAFNHGLITSHDPATGETLWQRPWGNGNVVCSSPVLVGTNRVLFSSGYSVGAELLEISHDAARGHSAKTVWKSIRMKSKFGHLFARDGFLYGLDDGIFACVNLADGSQRWKEGRYGHGQGLLVGDLYLLMGESGEIILLRPTPDAPNELARFRVFGSRTWNPMALSGDMLLVRNDHEAVCLQLPVTR